MPSALVLPPILRAKPFTYADAVAAGVSDSALRHRRFRRLHQSVWICADVELTQAIRFDAARLALPAGAVGSHHTAAGLLDLPVPRSSRPQFWLPESAKGSRYPGIRVHWYQVQPDTTTVDDRTVTTPGKTFVDLATQLSLVDLVAVGDAAVRAGLVTTHELIALGRERGRRHIRKARVAASLVRQRVDSARETRLRLLLVFAGLPEPVTGRAVHDATGGWLATPDLSYPEYKIAIEYDGIHHLTRRQRSRDIFRRENLIADGWIVIEVVADHLDHQPAPTVMRVLEALQNRGHPLAPRWPNQAWEAHFHH